MSSHQRRSPRKGLVYYLEVRDDRTGMLLGHLADLSPEGLRLVSVCPTVVGRLVQLRIVCPEDLHVGGDIFLPAICRWCARDINPDLYAAGFQFLEPSPAELDRLTMLMERLGLSV